MNRSGRATPYAKAALLLAVALLLFAQQLGLSHALWHATQSQTAKSPERTGDTQLPHAAKLCPLDALLAQVLGAGPIAAHVFHAARVGEQTLSTELVAAASIHAVVPRSRGPPILL